MKVACRCLSGETGLSLTDSALKVAPGITRGNLQDGKPFIFCPGETTQPAENAGSAAVIGTIDRFQHLTDVLGRRLMVRLLAVNWSRLALRNAPPELATKNVPASAAASKERGLQALRIALVKNRSTLFSRIGRRRYQQSTRNHSKRKKLYSK